MELQHVRMPNSELGRWAQAFSSAEKVLEHIEAHLLDQEEGLRWRRIAPGLHELLPDERTGVRKLQMARNGDFSEIEPIYALYCETVNQEMGDAQSLGWHNCGSRPSVTVCVAMGTSGVLALFECDYFSPWIMRTAFIPGVGSKARTVKRKMQAFGYYVAQPPGRGMLEGRFRKSNMDRRDLEKMQERERQWTTEQWIFYRSFRPALQFVWKTHRNSTALDGKIIKRTTLC